MAMATESAWESVLESAWASGTRLGSRTGPARGTGCRWGRDRAYRHAQDDPTLPVWAATASVRPAYRACGRALLALRLATPTGWPLATRWGLQREQAAPGRWARP